MKKWRIAESHPEDRYEPDDEVIDKLRADIGKIQLEIEGCKTPNRVNQLYIDLQTLRIALAERLYGK